MYNSSEGDYNPQSWAGPHVRQLRGQGGLEQQTPFGVFRGKLIFYFLSSGCYFNNDRHRFVLPALRTVPDPSQELWRMADPGWGYLDSTWSVLRGRRRGPCEPFSSAATPRPMRQSVKCSISATKTRSPWAVLDAIILYDKSQEYKALFFFLFQIDIGYHYGWRWLWRWIWYWFCEQCLQ